MEKIYGYKEKDILGLAEFIKNRGNSSLSDTFEKYSALSGKAKGTVRNLYYALAKLSAKDKEFCNKYLNGKSIIVSSILEFEPEDERELIKKILLGKKDGRSARSVIMELAHGDGKLALRYQNKFRNAIKTKSKLVMEIIAEIKGEESLLLSGGVKKSAFSASCIQDFDAAFIKIKRQINEMLAKTTFRLRKENEYLKDKINILEEQNTRLNQMLFGEKSPKTALRILNRSGDKVLLS